MSSGGKNITVGYRYYMSLLMGIGRGPVDEIVQIKAGDVNAWPLADGTLVLLEQLGIALPPNAPSINTVAEGPNGTGSLQFEDGTFQVVAAESIRTVSGSEETFIDAKDIFGGEKKEGGIEGALRVMMGYPGQVVPSYIKTLIGGRVPDYRGVTTMFFDGLISMINPYPKAWKVRVRRTTRGWDGDVWQPSLAVIWMRDGTVKAMNPAHILYECLTNRDWGRGFPRAWLNDAKMVEIAQTLYDEDFGMCLRWSRSGELGEFIQMVIDHIGGSLYVDRASGLISMDLIRADYDPASLPTFTYSSGLLSIEEAETSTQEDVINEVIVTWKDQLRNEDRQVRVHNLASLQSLGGGKNSTKTNYDGAPDAELALRLAQRDLKANASSLKRFKVILDRRAWRGKPGDVFRVSAPDKDIFNVVLRAGKVASGTNTDGKITVDAVIDVFGLPFSSFTAQPEVEWTPQSRIPVPASRSMVREANYRDLVLALGPGDLQTVTDDAATIATMAAKPTDLSQAYNIASRTDGEDFVNRGSGTFLSSAKVASVVSLSSATVSFDNEVDLGLVTPGIAVQVGDEIMSLIEIDAFLKTMTVGRGCADTVPQIHNIGTDIFFMVDEPGTDGREYASGETVNVKILPYTSSSILPQSQAPTVNVPIVARQGRPWPPGAVTRNGAPLGSPVLGSDNVVLAWAHRDRKLIQDQLLPHGSGSVGPEPGTTYRVRVYATETAPTPVRTVGGITGTTWTYTNSMASEDGVTNEIWFELESVRNGSASFQKYRFALVSSFRPVDELVVQVSDPAATEFATGVFTRTPFFTESLDSEDKFSSNDRYTAPGTADYRFVFDVAFDGATLPLAPGSTWDLKIDTYSSPSSGLVTGQSASGVFDGATQVQLSTDITLSTGDVVSAYLRHNNGGNITVASAALSIVKLV